MTNKFVTLHEGVEPRSAAPRQLVIVNLWPSFREISDSVIFGALARISSSAADLPGGI